MVQLTKCLPHKHEDPRLDHQNQCQSQETWWPTVIPTVSIIHTTYIQTCTNTTHMKKNPFHSNPGWYIRKIPSAGQDCAHPSIIKVAGNLRNLEFTCVKSSSISGWLSVQKALSRWAQCLLHWVTSSSSSLNANNTSPRDSPARGAPCDSQHCSGNIQRCCS